MNILNIYWINFSCFQESTFQVVLLIGHTVSCQRDNNLPIKLTWGTSPIKIISVPTQEPIDLMHMTSLNKKYALHGGKRVWLQLSPTNADSWFVHRGIRAYVYYTVCFIVLLQTDAAWRQCMRSIADIVTQDYTADYTYNKFTLGPYQSLATPYISSYSGHF